MREAARWLLIGLALASLTGCAGMAAKQASVAQFDQAAHTALAAESSFLDAVETVNCEDQYYTAALAYSQGKSSNFDLSGTCTPSNITPEQIATRKALLDALSLYADKMQALAGAGDDQALDQNSIALAQNLNGLAQVSGVQGGGSRLAQGVATALEAITKMALDRTKYADLRNAAIQMQAPIETVVAALVSENNILGRLMTNSLSHMQINMKIAIAQTHSSQPADAAGTFFQIVEARKLLMRANPLRQTALVAPDNAALGVDRNSAKPVNDALEAIVVANREIAQSGAGGARAAVKALYQRSMSARDFYNAIAR